MLELLGARDPFLSRFLLSPLEVQIAHDAQRDITFKLGESFNDYLMATQKISKKDLEALGIRLSLGDQKDPDGVGFFFLFSL